MCRIIQFTCILIHEVFIHSVRYQLAMEKDAEWARPKTQEQKEINELFAECRHLSVHCLCFHNRIYAGDQPSVTTDLCVWVTSILVMTLQRALIICLKQGPVTWALGSYSHFDSNLHVANSDAWINHKVSESVASLRKDQKLVLSVKKIQIFCFNRLSLHYYM